jgi:hypothetical protein
MTKCKECGQDLSKIPKIPKKLKIEKFKGTDEDWLKKAAILAFSYIGTAYHCQHCDYPVIGGYCCTFCGSAEPGSADEDNDSTQYLFSWPE